MNQQAGTFKLPSLQALPAGAASLYHLRTSGKAAVTNKAKEIS